MESLLSEIEQMLQIQTKKDFKKISSAVSKDNGF